LQKTQLHCCTGGSSRKTVLAGNEDVLAEVLLALRGTNFSRKPASEGPLDWVAEARPLWLSWAIEGQPFKHLHLWLWLSIANYEYGVYYLLKQPPAMRWWYASTTRYI
jgi:hypothetical protein